MSEADRHFVTVDLKPENVVVYSNVQVTLDKRVFTSSTQTDVFKSAEEAKNKLEALQKMYQKFSKLYTPVEVSQAVLVLGSFAAGCVDFINSNPNTFPDLLRFGGSVGLLILTSFVDGGIMTNVDKTGQKIQTIKAAEKSGNNSFSANYPID